MSKAKDRIEERYQENCRRLKAFDGCIFSQKDSRVKDLLFGKRGHIGAEGCGAVAIYNVMKFIEQPQDFCDILREMEKLHMPWLGAKFGTKPHSLGRYFSKHRIFYRKYNAPVDFKAALLSHRIGILCTWNRRFRGMHFYCIYFSNEENKYYSINCHSTDKDFMPITLDEISNLRFITGYVV